MPRAITSEQPLDPDANFVGNRLLRNNSDPVGDSTETRNGTVRVPIVGTVRSSTSGAVQEQLSAGGATELGDAVRNSSSIPPPLPYKGLTISEPSFLSPAPSTLALRTTVSVAAAKKNRPGFSHVGAQLGVVSAMKNRGTRIRAGSSHVAAGHGPSMRVDSRFVVRESLSSLIFSFLSFLCLSLCLCLCLSLSLSLSLSWWPCVCVAQANIHAAASRKRDARQGGGRTPRTASAVAGD